LRSLDKRSSTRRLACVLGLVIELSVPAGAAPQQRPDKPNLIGETGLSKQVSVAEAAVAQRPQDPQVLMRLVKLYQLEGEFGKSLTLLERFVVLAPGDLEGQRLLGIDRFHAGQPREALDPLRLAAEGNPKDHEASFYLGLCYLALDRDDEANKAFDRLAAGAPENIDELYWLVKGYSRVSSAMLSRLAALGEESYRMHQVRGEYFDLKNDPDRAIKEYEKAVQLRPDLSSLHYVLGGAYWKWSQLNEAAAELRRSIGLDSQHFMAHYKLGMVLLEQNNPADALKEFRAALNGQPGLVNGYLGLGKSLYQQGEFEAAVPILQRYAGLAPEDPTPHYLLQQIFHRLNNPNAAEEQLALFKQKQAEAKAKEPRAIKFPED
jgi:tetratricopeptide (TPR) repeat protein